MRVWEARFAASKSERNGDHAPRTPNGGVQLPRARQNKCLKSQRSRARSGRLERCVRRSGRHRSGCLPHAPTTPAYSHAGTPGVRSEPRASGITPGRTSVDLNHAPLESPRPERASSTTGLRTTRGTTGTQHNAPAYHTGITGAGTTEEAQRAIQNRDRLIKPKTGRRSRSPDAERFAVQPPRAHARKRIKMPTILCAQRSAATACSASRSPSLTSHPHLPTTPTCSHTGTTGVRSTSRPSGITQCIPGRNRNHAQHTIRLARTGAPHNGRANHTLHNAPSAQRACVPHPAQRAPARRRRHNARLGSAIRRIQIDKGMAITLPRVPNGGVQPRRHVDRNTCKHKTSLKIATILLAAQRRRLECVVGLCLRSSKALQQRP